MIIKSRIIPAKPRNKELYFKKEYGSFVGGGSIGSSSGSGSATTTYWELVTNDDNGVPLEQPYIKTIYPVVGEKEISAFGLGSLGGSTGVFSIENAVDVQYTGLAVDNLLKYNGTHWVNIPMSSITPNLTGYATEVYVNNKITDLIGSSPSTLDTLNELAAALGNDPNFATTLTNQIAAKQDKLTAGTNITISGNVISAAASANNYLTSVTGSGNGTLTFTRSGLTDLTVDLAHTHTFASLTSKPTTISGFGITDAYTKTVLYTKTESDNKFATITSLNTHTGDTVAHLTNAEHTQLTQLLGWFKLDANGNVYTEKNFYSTLEVSAYGVGSGSGGTGSYNRLDSWIEYDTSKSGWVLSALLGYDLHSRVNLLEGGSATTVNTTGTGNAITAISKSGTTITATKGSTFSLDGHTHDYLPLTGGTLTGALTANAGIILPTGVQIKTSSNVEVFRVDATKVIIGVSSFDTRKVVIAGDPIVVQQGFFEYTVYHSGNLLAATQTTAGLLSSSDKTKLDGIAAGAKTGTVTSVAMTVPTGLSVSGSPITTSGTLAVSLASGYSIPTTAKQTQWDTAYTNNHTHTNKTVLDGITSTLVSNWNTAYINNHTHTNKTIIDKITQGNIDVLSKLSIDASGNLKIDTNAYATGELSAYGAGTGGGSGSSYERLDSWTDYGTGKEGWVLSALLGKNLDTRVSSLEGGSATTIGTGNAITKIEKAGTTITATKGATFAELDANGKIISSQLPSYVDDVIEAANLAGFPATGETGKIYIAQDSNKTYRWSGTAYVEISASLALGTTSSTAFRGDYGNTAYTHSQSEHQSIINGTGFVKANGKTLSYDNSSYSLSSHNHSGVYQPLHTGLTNIATQSANATIGLLKKTAANTWIFDTNTYSLSNHDHAGIYEPVFSKNTAFNKNFGTTAGTVAEGNHTHSYLPLTGGTMSNANLVSNLNADLLDGVHLTGLTGRGVYHATDGILVETTILATAAVMVYGRITGNSYNGIEVPIDTTFQFYNYPTSDAILSYSAVNNGYSIPSIKAFNYSGLVYLHIPYLGSYKSVNIEVWRGHGYYKIDVTSGVNNSIMPTTGVTRLVTITPVQSAFTTSNVASATKLQTARTIAGVLFDGTANISIPFANLLSIPTTLSGYGITDGVINTTTITAGNGLTGGGTLSAGRTLTLGTPSDISSATTNSVTSTSHTHALTNSGVTAGTYRSVTVDVKGRVTAGTNPTTVAGYGLTDAVTINTAQTITGSKLFQNHVTIDYDKYIGIAYSSSDKSLYNYFYGGSVLNLRVGEWTSGAINTFNIETKGGVKALSITNISGNVGIGEPSPSAKLHVVGNILTTGALETSRLGQYGTYNSAQTQGIWSMGNAYNVAASTTTLGTQYGLAYSYISVGGSSVASKHQIHFAFNGAAKVSVNLNDGNITASGEVTAFVASDLRLKENIKLINNSLDLIDKLNPVSYNWNSLAKELNPNKSDDTDYGLIAQEVEEVLPNVVHGIFDNKYKSIDYIKLVPILISAVKELREEINKLK